MARLSPLCHALRLSSRPLVVVSPAGLAAAECKEMETGLKRLMGVESARRCTNALGVNTAVKLESNKT